jgi:hypothetical protein
MGSTVNPMSNGGSEYKDLFFNGYLLDEKGKRNINGRTKSGLYSIFIPAYRCIIYDRYGNSVVEDPDEPIETIDGDIVEIGGKTFLENQRESLKSDPKAYNEEIRQMPFTVREAFMDTLDDCIFNLQKIEEQLMYNDAMHPNPIVSGNFKWKDGKLDTVVEWHPDRKAGRFKVVWMPKPENRSIIQRNRQPPHAWLGVGGVDSYDLDSTVYEGSKGGLYLYNKNDPNGASNMFVLEYVARPKTAEQFYEDCLMAAVFYGYPLLIENAKYSIANYFNRRGYGAYLINRPVSSFAIGTKISPAERQKKGIPASPELIQDQARLLEAYTEEHIGYNDDGEIGNCFFNTLLDQMKNYDIKDRTKSDAVVAAGHALYAAKIDGFRKVEEDKIKKPIFRTFKI